MNYIKARKKYCIAKPPPINLGLLALQGKFALTSAGAEILRPQGVFLMIHYTCDMCGRKINKETDERSRIMIDVELILPGEEESDFDSDFDEDFDDFGFESEDEEGYVQSFKFDLCRDCAEIYMRDPLARKLPRRLRLLDN